VHDYEIDRGAYISSFMVTK